MVYNKANYFNVRKLTVIFAIYEERLKPVLYDTLLLVLGLLVAILVLASIAVQLRIPYPIMLVLGGALLGFVPGLPRIELDPELILSLFLPPLVYSAAWFTSWRDFRANLRPISLLAVGLVLANMVVIALIAHTFIHMPWAVAFTLGAVVSPTDTVAANAITQTIPIARRVVTIIEGESLVNDATGLVAYRFAIAAVVSGVFSLWQAGLQFFIVSGGGIALGLVIAWLLAWLHKRIDDAPREITMTLLTPFVAYLLAEAMGLSGVLAAVTVGLYLGRQSSVFFSPGTRLQANAFWNVLVFLFNGFIFLLVGLEMHTLFAGLTDQSLASLIWYGVIISLAVILVRLVYIFVTTILFYYLPWVHYNIHDWRYSLIIGWAGMRGGVSLATALAIPAVIANGSPFPDRDLVILLAFCVILSTLVVQGLSLGPLIRLLGVKEDDVEREEMKKAALQACEAGRTRINELSSEDWFPDQYADRLRAFSDRLARSFTSSSSPTENNAEGRKAAKEQWRNRQRLREEVVQVMRSTVIQLRDENVISDDVLRRIERRFDLEEERLER